MTYFIKITPHVCSIGKHVFAKSHWFLSIHHLFLIFLFPVNMSTFVSETELRQLQLSILTLFLIYLIFLFYHLFLLVFRLIKLQINLHLWIQIFWALYNCWQLNVFFWFLHGLLFNIINLIRLILIYLNVVKKLKK